MSGEVMSSRVLDPDNPKPPEKDLVECPMCHTKVPERLLTFHGGRRICLDCYGSWFEDGDEEQRD